LWAALPIFFGTGIPAASLFYKENEEEKHIVFIDASRHTKMQVNKQTAAEDIEKIVATYLDFSEIEKYSHVRRSVKYRE